MQNTILLSDKHKRLIQATFPKVMLRSDTISELFFTRLFWADEHTITLFNQSRREQTRLLMQALSTIVSLLDKPDELKAAILDLGQLAHARSIKKQHYRLFGKVFISALELALHPGTFTPEVREAWIALYTMLASIAAEVYDT